MSNLEQRIMQTVTHFNGWPDIVYIYTMLADDLALSNKFSRQLIDSAIQTLIESGDLVKVSCRKKSGHEEHVFHIA